MRTHLGCTGRVELGKIGQESRRRLEQVDAAWLEFTSEPPALVVRHVQPTELPPLPAIGSELLEFLSKLPESERAQVVGGAFYGSDEESGQFVRFKVAPGGIVAIAWAKPDYARANWQIYRGQAIPLVFDAYQRLNGSVRLAARPELGAEIQAVVDRFAGLGTQGEVKVTESSGQIEIVLRDVNSSVVPLLGFLREKADPASSLEGEIDVSSFRAGDVEDYCRFVLRTGEIWVVRPSLWSEFPAEDTAPPAPLKRAA